MAGNSARRVGAENSATRAAILDAADALLREEGYGAVSTRKVAARAGLKPSLVHYYFPTTDDLWLAVFRRGAEQSDAMLDTALASENPLKALWKFLADTSRTAQTLEVMALANRRKAVRAEIAVHSEQMRKRQVEALTRIYGDRLSAYDPAGLTLVLAGVGRALVMEGGFGVQGGHEEARRMVEDWIETLTRDKGAA